MLIEAGFGVYRFSARYMAALGIDTAEVEKTYKPNYFSPSEGNNYYHSSLKSLSDRQDKVVLTNYKATFIEGLIYESIMGVNWLGQVLTIDLTEGRLLVQ